MTDEPKTPETPATDHGGRKRHGRAKGNGTLVKRGGIYQARWVVDGKTYCRSTGTGLLREAEKILRDFTAPYVAQRDEDRLRALNAQLEGAVARNRAFKEAEPGLGLMAGWTAYERSQNRPDTGPDTMRMYQSEYFRLVGWLKEHHPGATELRHVTREMAEGFARYIGGKFSANTHNKYVALLRLIWNVLAAKPEHKITDNPWSDIRRKLQIAHTRRELTVDELERVCKSVTGEMRVLFALGIYTGLRLRDCATVEWGAVDLARGVISIAPHKTKRHTGGTPILVPIHAALAQVLAETPQERRNGPVLPETARAYIADSGAVSAKIQRVFKRCGIRTQAEKESETDRARVDVGFHSLRHTFVSLCANAKVPLALVQSIVGHSNPAMTMHYFHQSAQALQEAVSALPDVTAEQSAEPERKPTTTPIDAIRAIAEGMTPAELREAADLIEGLILRRTIGGDAVATTPADGADGAANQNCNI